MASGIAPVNWTADGTDMVDVDGICLHQLVNGGPGEPADTRGGADVIPALIGEQPRLWEKDRRVIEFRGFVRGVSSSETNDRDDYWDNRVALESTLDVTEIVHLVITLPGGAEYSIDARPTSIAYSQKVPSFAECSVEFESFDPDWTSGS